MAKEERPAAVESPVAAEVSSADKAKFDELVKAKVAAGLPKGDAEEVARRQIEHDKALAKQGK